MSFTRNSWIPSWLHIKESIITCELHVCVTYKGEREYFTLHRTDAWMLQNRSYLVRQQMIVRAQLRSEVMKVLMQ